MSRTRSWWAMLALVWAICPAAAVRAEPAVWTVRSAHATAILFGSIHMLPEGLKWEPPALTAALSRANEIWFEIPIDADSDAAAEQLTQSLGELPKGQSLYEQLPNKDAAAVAAACARFGLDPQVLVPLRPWLADVVLSLAQDRASGAMTTQGVEQQVSAQVPATARRDAFETPAEQINFLAGASKADQIASLEETLNELTQKPDLYTEVVNAWLAGDVKTLEKDALGPLAAASPSLYRRLITDRNQRWAAILAQRLQGSGDIVVVVGAAHLAGPGGLPRLLRKRGFKVTGPGFPDPRAR